MRLLLTTDTIGGVWTFTSELTLGLLERGHSVALVSLGRVPFDSQRMWASKVTAMFGDRFYYEASNQPLEWMANNNLAYLGAEATMLRVISSFQPDVFHTSQFCFGALQIAIPKVLTAHSDVLSWAETCRPSGMESSPWLSKYRALVEAGLRGADAVAAPTAWMGQKLKEHYEFELTPRIIANGRKIDLPNEPCPRHLQAISVGRLWDEAKHIGIFGEVLSSMPILIAGGRSLDGAHAPGHCGGALFLGQLSEDEILQLFISSSVYIATSIYEPFGLAPLEAALCGCAILANDIPSLREVWADGALYFTDASSLSSLLEHLHHHPASLLTLRGRSMQRARQFSRERMTKDYLNLYTSLPMSWEEMPEEVAAYAG